MTKKRKSQDGRAGRFSHRNNIYLLPNFITTTGLFCGFYAIISALNGAIEQAVLATLAAVILDALDGRVARLTKTATAFGAEYDSLSDMVSFGVAPALIVFNWGLSNLGNLGWACVFIYTACTALRLARFNVDHDNSSGFVGLASPAAATVVVSGIWVAVSSSSPASSPPYALSILFMLTVVGLGILMVSNIKYWSPKRLSLRNRAPFISMVAFVSIFSLISIDPPKVILTLTLVYIASGPLQILWNRLFRKSSEDADDLYLVEDQDADNQTKTDGQGSYKIHEP